MSGELRLSELMQIYNLVVKKLTPQHISWLKEHRKEWEKVDFDNRDLYPYQNNFTVIRRTLNGGRDWMQRIDISFAIQDMMDAVSNKTETTYKVELTRPMMEVLAIMLDVQDRPHRNKFQILGAILSLASPGAQ